MATKKPCVMLILAVVAVVLLNRAAMAQQVSLGNQYSKANLQRGTTRSGPSRLKVLRPAPNTNERPKQTEIEKEFAAAARVMASYKQWMIGANATGFVYPNTTSGPASKKYNLKGLVNKKFLQYEKQGTFGGINLGWTQTASAGTAIDRAQWIFQRPGGPSEQLAPLVYGEPIALGWSKGSNPFLKYAKRNVGINLDWSDAVFEWTILGRTPGTNVGRGQDVVILYNLKHQMPLMRFDRTKGGDIGWPDSTRWSAKSVFHSPDYLASFRKAADVMMGK